MSEPSGLIRTPDQRLRVFVSSTIGELAPERAAVKQAIQHLRLAPVLFEMGARPHPPRDLYRAYLEQSDIFVGIYWQSYGWVAPEEEISGLEDEYRLSTGKPRLIYLKEPAPQRQERLKTLISQIRDGDTASYQKFGSAEELAELVADDLALLLSERFSQPQHANFLTRLDVPSVPPDAVLPVPRGTLVGRDAELEQLKALLTRPDVGLVTLTGPGGGGKTRLALEAAPAVEKEFPDGIVFVRLSTIRDAALVAPTIAHALGVPESPSIPTDEALKRTLRERRTLLILDNFEQVLGAASLVAGLVEACPKLVMLVTSRSVLRLRGEHDLAVLPLATDPNETGTAPAVTLFLTRAREINPGLLLDDDNRAAVEEIVARLDGLPLAIELAAALVRTLTPRAILTRMSGALTLLTRGARDLPDRQQTLRRTIAWSYDLLDEPTMRLFRSLAVFRGGFTLPAAAAVSGDDPGVLLDRIETLVDSSLVVRVDNGPRFEMLATIREFAAEQLSAAEAEAASLRHLEFVTSLVEECSLHFMTGGREPWLRRLDREYDNCRAALAPAIERLEPAGGSLVLGLCLYWYFRGYLREGQQWGRRLLESIGRADSQPGGPPVSPNVRAAANFAVGNFGYLLGDLETARARLPAAVTLLHQTGNEVQAAFARGYWGLAEISLGSPEGQTILADTLTLMQQAGKRWCEAVLLLYLANAELVLGDEQVAETAMQRSVTLGRDLGDDWLTATAAGTLGLLALLRDDYRAADRFSETAVAGLRSIGDRYGMAAPLAVLGLARLHLGDPARAADAIHESIHVARQTNAEGHFCGVATGLASFALADGDPAGAAIYAAAASHLASYRPGTMWPPFRLASLRELAILRPLLDPIDLSNADALIEAMPLEDIVSLVRGEIPAPPVEPAGHLRR